MGIVTGTTYTSSLETKGLSIKDIFSSKATYASYEKSLEEAKENAFQKLKNNAELMKANAIVGVTVDIESVAFNDLIGFCCWHSCCGGLRKVPSSLSKNAK